MKIFHTNLYFIFLKVLNIQYDKFLQEKNRLYFILFRLETYRPTCIIHKKIVENISVLVTKEYMHAENELSSCCF